MEGSSSPFDLFLHLELLVKIEKKEVMKIIHVAVPSAASIEKQHLHSEVARLQHQRPGYLELAVNSLADLEFPAVRFVDYDEKQVKTFLII